MNGVINVLKPPGMTSHDVVYLIRKITGRKKAGHTGTLDPGAAGVLPVCLGKATRIIEFLPDLKMYRAEVSFGRSTTTQDAFGDIIKERYAGDLDVESVEQCLAGFRGLIKQIPPMVSAVKHQGKKLYELARAGVEVERKPRTVHIYELALVNFINHEQKAPRAIIDVCCSAGTYIRTLCHDMGEKLGCGAYMSFLLRTRAGIFRLEDTITLQQLKEKSINQEIGGYIMSMSKALEHLPSVRITESLVKAVSCGNKVFLPGLSIEYSKTPSQLVRVEGPNGLLALATVNPVAGKPEYRMIQPVKVLV